MLILYNFHIAKVVAMSAQLVCIDMTLACQSGPDLLAINTGSCKDVKMAPMGCYMNLYLELW
jgi:hypothetical protein